MKREKPSSSSLTFLFSQERIALQSEYDNSRREESAMLTSLRDATTSFLRGKTKSKHRTYFMSDEGVKTKLTQFLVDRLMDTEVEALQAAVDKGYMPVDVRGVLEELKAFHGAQFGAKGTINRENLEDIKWNSEVAIDESSNLSDEEDDEVKPKKAKTVAAKGKRVVKKQREPESEEESESSVAPDENSSSDESSSSSEKVVVIKRPKK